MAGELDRVSRELSCLQSVIAEPDELNAEPASDYETLRRQYLSLRLMTNSALARNRYLCRRDDRDMRAALSVNAANVSAERDTNAMLTDLLEKAEAERDALHAEAEALRKRARPAQAAPQELRIVLDGPPGPEAGRFVEVENAAGRSVNAGEWRERADGLWELVLHAAQGGE